MCKWERWTRLWIPQPLEVKHEKPVKETEKMRWEQNWERENIMKAKRGDYFKKQGVVCCGFFFNFIEV